MYCEKCGKEISEEAVVCPACGCATHNYKREKVASVSNYRNDDEVSVGLCILSALLPIFGIIYWPVKAKETPKRAKACGITSLVAWAVYMIIALV